VVEIEGERVLAASCLRKPVEGMRVNTQLERVKAAQRMVMELLLADQPERASSPDQHAGLWRWADDLGVNASRFPRRDTPEADASHPAMRVALQACIHCTLCLRACREVQINDVIGMAYRGRHTKVVFDFDDSMGASSCVACGECVQVCPTGALREATRVDARGVGSTGVSEDVASVCPYCGVGCQLTYQVEDKRIVAVQGRNGPSNEERLCVKGRFGFDYVSHAHRLTRPLVRRDDAPKSRDCQLDPANPWSHFREKVVSRIVYHLVFKA
jgi:formate dehydrogenase major subunit